MATDFVEDWAIVSTLGEGAFGEVKLLLNKTTGDAVAMKMIDLDKHPNAAESVRKEVCIHRMVSNPNIIKYYGQRKEGNREYIFLEYAAGGELFDRIEPDVGMPSSKAQQYMKQLLSGVSYLHRCGIAHRDVKPENLLLDKSDNLKISDFGMATMFRMKGRERMLDTRCGTLPYVAPEVISRKPYRAPPADIWSCGIVLVAMLTGELPWDKPTRDCPEYMNFHTEKFPTTSPWTKLDNMTLSLICGLLKQEPERRATIEHANKHRWMKHMFSANDTIPKLDSLKPGSVKRLRSGDFVNGSEDDVDCGRPCLSQPEPHLPANSEDMTSIENGGDATAQICFSQPVRLDDLLLCTQFNLTQNLTQSTATQDDFRTLIKRMTRFFVKVDADTAIKHLSSYMEHLNYKYNIGPPGMMTITTTDRQNVLVFKAHVLDMNNEVLIDFRRSKGCGLEFKRRFVDIKLALDSIITEGKYPLEPWNKPTVKPNVDKIDE